MLSEYTEPFEPRMLETLDTHLNHLFFDSMAREFEDDPGLQDYPIDVIAKATMLRVIAVLEDRLPSEFWVEEYETWLKHQY